LGLWLSDEARQIQGAEVALFYYAGHGVQVNGSSYLVPVGANPTREADVDFQMVDVNLMLRQMQGSGTRLNVVILDACRNNPFGGRGLRSADCGLAQLRAPEGTLISYATSPAASPRTEATAAALTPTRACSDHQASRARHLSDFQPGWPFREAGDWRITAALDIFLTNRRLFLFRCARGGRSKDRYRAGATKCRYVATRSRRCFTC
jgi:hypothetical protein